MATRAVKSKTDEKNHTTSVPPARIPAWLKSAELSSASANIDLELSARHFPIDEASPDQLERLVKAAAKRELSYITNPEFDEEVAQQSGRG